MQRQLQVEQQKQCGTLTELLAVRGMLFMVGGRGATSGREARGGGAGCSGATTAGSGADTGCGTVVSIWG